MHLTADRLFFSAAALYGALAVPIFVQGLFASSAWLPGLAASFGHAREMLFGYALAVVAGFLVTRASQGRVLLLFGLWLGARLAYLFTPSAMPAALLNIGFAALLAWTAAPPLLRAAKKLRNRVLGPVVVLICLVLALSHGLRAGSEPLQHLLLQYAVLLFAVMLLFMGGRIIASAVAGAIERRGGVLEARVQPRIEAALLALMIGAVLLAGPPGAQPLAGLGLVLAGGLAAIRLARWRLWLVPDRVDLLCLGAGYGWLALGLVLLGGSWAWHWLAPSAALHALTVGALGTLTTMVMARISLVRARRDPAEAGLVLAVITLLLAIAAGLRVFAAHTPAGLQLAAASWSLALLLLLPLLVGSGLRSRAARRARPSEVPPERPAGSRQK